MTVVSQLAFQFIGKIKNYLFTMEKNQYKFNLKNLSEKLFIQFSLTTDQTIFLNKILPKGYSLQTVNRLTIRQRKLQDKTKCKRQKEIVHQNQRIQCPKKIENLKKSRLSRKISKDIIKQKQIKPNILKDESNFSSEQYIKIINQLKKQKCAIPFLSPVDPIEEGIPDYYQIIKQPIDLSTIQKKVKNKEYNSKKEFCRDLEKMFQNSYDFNHHTSQVYKYTIHLEKIYLKLMKNEQLIDLQRDLQKKVHEINKKHEINIQKKKNEKEITFSIQELENLGEKIKNLEQYQLKMLFEMISEGSSQNELEIDLISLDKKKLILVHRFFSLKEKVLSNRNHSHIIEFEE